MCVIFWFSAQNAQRSSAQSDGLILLFFSRFLSDGISEAISTVVRKSAHFCAYALLGSLFYLSFEQKRSRKRVPVCLSLACSMLYAVTDELHQFFVPGRAARLFDVAIDSAGALTGIVCVFALLVLFRKIRDKRADYKK